MKLTILRRLVYSLVLLLTAFSASAYRTDTISVSGPGFVGPMKALVVVPDGLGEGAHYPTVYLLHGYSGGYTNWLGSQPRIGELADEFGLIVVTPGVGDTWYFDSPEKPEQQIETFFINTLIPYVDANYPTIPRREKRAIAGLSMGGHGALYLAGRHPEVFGAADAISGGVDIRPFPNSWKIKESLGSKDKYPERWDANTVATMVPRFKEANLAIMIDCGAEDFFHEVNEQLHKDLLAAGVPHVYTSRPGAHTWKYWKNAVLYGLLFFNEYFNQ